MLACLSSKQTQCAADGRRQLTRQDFLAYLSRVLAAPTLQRATVIMEARTREALEQALKMLLVTGKDAQRLDFASCSYHVYDSVTAPKQS